MDPDVLHGERDFASRFWSGSDQTRSRVWLWHVDGRRLGGQPSPSERTFQAHSTWIEAICRHGANWGGHEGQYPHPHSQCAPTGERIVYNAANRGRSDVFVVEV